MSKEVAKDSGEDAAKQAVLMIVPQPFYTLRGSPMRVRATLEALVELGFVVEIVVFALGTALQSRGVHLHRAPGIPWIRYIPIGFSWQKMLFDVMLFFSAFKLMWSNRARISVIHGVEEGGFIAMLLGLCFRRPFVFDMHSHMSEQLGSKRAKLMSALSRACLFLERLSIRRAAAVVTVADRLTDFAKECSPAGPVVTVEDAPLEVAASETVYSCVALKKQFGLEGLAMLLYTGNFQAYQGVDLLIEAFARYVHSGSAQPAALVLVGGGDSESIELMQLKKLVSSLDISCEVYFAGECSVDEVSEYMVAADLLVSPRLHGENTPLKIYTYMRSGKPLLATDISSHTQVLDRSCALLCPPTPSAMSEAIAYALESSEERKKELQRLSEESRRRVEDRYSKRHFRRKLETAYRQFR